MDYSKAFDSVEKKRERLAKMTSDLIRIDTTVPPGRGYTDMVDYLEPLFEAAGLRTERVVVPEERWRKIPLPLEGERVNLVATLATGSPPVSIYAHMDVVPAGEGWELEPFGGVISDGEVHGRGAVDMKGAIAPVVVAMEVIRELGLEPRFEVGVLLCTDEEIGIDPGALFLAENGYFKPPVIHLEGGGQGPVMVVANAGSLGARITTKGQEVHSGLSFLGVNALEAMVPVMEELLLLKEDVEKRESGFDALPVPGAPSNKFTPTFNLNMISASGKLNVVPGRCELQIDRRYLPEENLDEVKGEIEDAVERARKKSKALEIEVDFLSIYLPHSIDIDSPHVKRWNDGVRLALGYDPGFDFLYPGLGGSTDMSFVGNLLKTDQFIGTGVIDLEHTRAHQANESVAIENLVHLAQELVYFLVDL